MRMRWTAILWRLFGFAIARATLDRFRDAVNHLGGMGIATEVTCVQRMKASRASLMQFQADRRNEVARVRREVNSLKSEAYSKANPYKGSFSYAQFICVAASAIAEIVLLEDRSVRSQAADGFASRVNAETEEEKKRRDKELGQLNQHKWNCLVPSQAGAAKSQWPDVSSECFKKRELETSH